MPARPPRARESSRRVLVVDDNRDSTDIISMLLSIKGHVVQTATNGAEAITVARSFAPEVAVLDLSLPVVDGYEVARRLREDFEDIHLIAVTGHVDQDTARLCFAAGFDRHLPKPLTDLDAFVQLVASPRDAEGQGTRGR